MRKATIPSSVRRRRSSRGSQPVDSATIRRSAAASSRRVEGAGRLGQRLEVRLHGVDLRHGLVDRGSTAVATACASSSGTSPGSLRCSETSTRPSHGRGPSRCAPRARAGRRAQLRAPARGRPPPPRSARRGRRRRSRARRCERPLRRRPRLRAPGRRRPPGETPMTTSAKWRPADWRSRSRRRSTGSVDDLRSRPRAASRAAVGRPVHEHVHVALAKSGGRGEDEPGDEQRGDRVRVRVSGTGADEPEQDGGRAEQVAAEVERVRLERRAAEAPRGPERRPRPRSVEHDHDADHDEGVPDCVDLALGRSEEAGDGERGDGQAQRGRGSTPPRARPGAPPCRGRTGARGRPAAPPRRRRRTSAAPRRGRRRSGAPPR